MADDKTLQDKIEDLLGKKLEDSDGLLEKFAAGKTSSLREWERLYLESLAEYTPRLFQGNIPIDVINQYAYVAKQISVYAYGGNMAVGKRTKWHMFQLARDLVGLYAKGLNINGMNAFLQYATKNCFTDGPYTADTPEPERDRIYYRAVIEIKKKLAEKSHEFMRNQGKQVKSLFELAAYEGASPEKTDS